MIQTNIFDYLDDVDPVFVKISKLKIGQQVDIEFIRVSLNKFGFYEVETTNRHEQFTDCEGCYEWVCEVIDCKVLVRV